MAKLPSDPGHMDKPDPVEVVEVSKILNFNYKNIKNLK
jgi:hypothetical protein